MNVCDMKFPVLYSFRRCPYAIRARLALRISGIQVALREVVLSDKPSALVDCSAKATVPVLVFNEKHVIDESLDIMYWALKQNDPQGWLVEESDLLKATQQLIEYNDNEFKSQLDQYKYADRFPENSMQHYRSKGELFLSDLEERLAITDYLLCQRPTLADMAILPFIRQFVYVDKDWFDRSRYKRLNAWLTRLLEGVLFIGVMEKYKKWQEDDTPVIF